MSLKNKILDALIVRDKNSDLPAFSAQPQNGVEYTAQQPTPAAIPEPPRILEPVSTPITGPTMAVDFQAIYDAAGVPSEVFTAEQMLDTLSALPQQLPVPMQQQTVNVMFEVMRKTTAVSPESVTEDASRKIAALASHATASAQQTTAQVSTLRTEINDLMSQIEAKKRTIAGAEQKQKQLTQVCHAESARLGRVLDFFAQGPRSQTAGSTR